MTPLRISLSQVAAHKVIPLYKHNQWKLQTDHGFKVPSEDELATFIERLLRDLEDRNAQQVSSGRITVCKENDEYNTIDVYFDLASIDDFGEVFA